MRKGVTETMAVVLLILIAIAVIGYAFVFQNNLFNNAAGVTDERIQSLPSSNVRIESLSDNTLFIRNVGQSSLEKYNTNVYVNKKLLNNQEFFMPAVEVGKVGRLVLRNAPNPGDQITIIVGPFQALTTVTANNMAETTLSASTTTTAGTTTTAAGTTTIAGATTSAPTTTPTTTPTTVGTTTPTTAGTTTTSVTTTATTTVATTVPTTTPTTTGTTTVPTTAGTTSVATTSVGTTSVGTTTTGTTTVPTTAGTTSVATTSVGTTTTTTISQCSDTDGQNAYAVGYVYLASAPSTFHWDLCNIENNAVLEEYCNGNTRAEILISCPYGCADRACKLETTTTMETTTTISSTKCLDTDGGQLSYTSGYVYLSSNPTVLHWDLCGTGGNGVTEYYCVADGYTTKYISCPYGCSGRACHVPTSTTSTVITTTTITSSQCTDTDGGRNYYLSGYVTLASAPTVRYYDSCSFDGSVHVLNENYCSGSIARVETFFCPMDCENGICIG